MSLFFLTKRKTTNRCKTSFCCVSQLFVMKQEICVKWMNCILGNKCTPPFCLCVCVGGGIFEMEVIVSPL